MLLSYRKCFPLVSVHDFDQKKACFCAWESATAAGTIGA